MRILISVGEPPFDTQWDKLEWDDKTIMTNPDARGLFTKMVGQSIQEWAEKAQMEAKHRASHEQRAVAMAEVEGEAEAKAIFKEVNNASF